jgi:hypothetical protein
MTGPLDHVVTPEEAERLGVRFTGPQTLREAVRAHLTARRERVEADKIKLRALREKITELRIDKREGRLMPVADAEDLLRHVPGALAAELHVENSILALRPDHGLREGISTRIENAMKAIARAEEARAEAAASERQRRAECCARWEALRVKLGFDETAWAAEMGRMREEDRQLTRKVCNEQERMAERAGHMGEAQVWRRLREQYEADWAAGVPDECDYLIWEPR